MILAIFAVDPNGGMGFDGKLPWPPIKEDFKWFQSVTKNNVVVMGKNTWLSPDMPKPLPNRINIIATNNPIDGCLTVQGDLCEALIQIQQQYPDKDICVIGGPKLITDAKPILDKILITYVHSIYTCDTFIDVQSLVSNMTPIRAQMFDGFTIKEYI